MKLPTSIRNAKNYKDCGAAFGQYLDRHAFWTDVLKEEIPGLKPYGLRHGFAWRAAKYYPKALPLRDTADLMRHDMRTHIRHYGQWTDEAGTEAAVEESIQTLANVNQQTKKIISQLSFLIFPIRLY